MRRSRRGYALLVAGLCFLGVLGAAQAADPVSFQEVEESLTCQCGCGLTVHACNHLQCPSAIPLREEIRAQMDQGKSKDVIMAYFSDKYGEKILSSPTAAGFNLFAWITPFAMLGIAGVILAVVLMRWTARGRVAQAQPPVMPAGSASQLEKILEKELKHFDG
jgi:cytochrome c-type biogenesis protein CcmH